MDTVEATTYVVIARSGKILKHPSYYILYGFLEEYGSSNLTNTPIKHIVKNHSLKIFHKHTITIRGMDGDL